MVALTNILLTMGLALAASADDFLAVIETNPTFRAGSANMGFTVQCVDEAKVYTIQRFDSHPGSVGSGCSWKGTHLATSKTDEVEGCNGGYTDGYSVCLNTSGGTIYDGKGYHQHCRRDDTVLLNCPNNMPCWTNMVRKLKCGPSWHKDD